MSIDAFKPIFLSSPTRRGPTPISAAINSGNRRTWPPGAAPRGLTLPCALFQMCHTVSISSDVEVGTYMRVTTWSPECLSALLASFKAANFKVALLLTWIVSTIWIVTLSNGGEMPGSRNSVFPLFAGN